MGSFIEFIAKCVVCSDVPEGEWLCPRCVAHAKKPSLTRTLSQQKVTIHYHRLQQNMKRKLVWNFDQNGKNGRVDGVGFCFVWQGSPRKVSLPGTQTDSQPTIHSQPFASLLCCAVSVVAPVLLLVCCSCLVAAAKQFSPREFDQIKSN